MERDCLIGYGAANLIMERLMLSSDKFTVYICKDCGFIGHKDGCDYCHHKKVTAVNIPYASKLMLQELQSMNIRT
jgi:DNA-directed RNA polymerase III subunit RPC2